MLKLIFSIAVIGVSVQSREERAAMPKPKPCNAILFRDKNFAGESVEADTEQFKCVSLSRFRSKTASIKVNNGCIKVFQHAGCTGHFICLCRNKDLSFEKLTDQIMDSGNGLVQSWHKVICSYSCCDSTSIPRGSGRSGESSRSLFPAETGLLEYSRINDKDEWSDFPTTDY